jgi:hypothetical protein
MEIMSFVENGFGPRYNERTSTPSAQTERWGVMRPVRLLRGGEDLTGRLVSLVADCFYFESNFFSGPVFPWAPARYIPLHA